MTAPTSIEALVGATISISATLPETYDSAGYQSTDFVGAWTAINKIEQYGNHGGSATVTTFADVATGVVEKVKGSKDFGAMNLMIGYINGDAGQALLKTAFDSNNTHYSIKIQYDDGAAATDETHFLDVLVTKFEYQDGGPNDVRKIACDLTLCRAPVIVAPT